jgi:hypothetical protein
MNPQPHIMVVSRRITDEKAAYRQGHRFGNWVLTEFVARLFGRAFTDILSGYRVFSRRFVKSFPALATGFEIESETVPTGASAGVFRWYQRGSFAGLTCAVVPAVSDLC